MGWAQSKPEFITVLAKKQVGIGKEVFLSCETNREGLTVTWEKDGEKLIRVQDKHIMKQDGTKCSLKILNTDEEDNGLYTIKLENKSGTASCSAMVIVELNEWRTVQWKQNEMVDSLKEFKMDNDQVRELNFLLFGPVGAGKSSIINTIKTIFEGRYCVICPVAAQSAESYTKTVSTRYNPANLFRNVNTSDSCGCSIIVINIGNNGNIIGNNIGISIVFAGDVLLLLRGVYFQYQKYSIRREGVVPLVFYDLMGVEKGETAGVRTDDVISALKGHIKEGYVFNPILPILEGNPQYLMNPSLCDRIHCLVNVIPAHTIALMDEKSIDKMKKVREAARIMGILQVVLMTDVDLACPLIKDSKSLRYIYRSKKIKENMQKCSNCLGVPVNCIFPVKNYHEETDVNEDTNCLMLDALKRIIPWAHEYVVKCSTNTT